MGNPQTLEGLMPILAYYALKPHFLEDFGRVKKVYTDKGVFALKRIPPNHGTEFFRSIRLLYQQGFNRIVPIYPTVDGRYAVLYDKHLYYLMPWLQNEMKENVNERHKQMFRELARIHTLSVREVLINKEEKEEHYEKTIHEWDNELEFIEGFIEQCEKHRYMSPFELLFCLYYFEIQQSIHFSKRKLEEWFEKTKDDDKARAVISHGNLSPEHFIYDDRGYGYFINFENSRQGSPLHDLLPFLSRTLKTFPKQSEECVDWLYTYLKFFPLKEDEMLLLQAYFAHPGYLLQTVQDYYKSNKQSERKRVEQLQRNYWLLKNTEYMVMRIDEIERQKKEAAEAEQQEGAQS